MKTFFVLFKDKRKNKLTQQLLVGHVEYLKELHSLGNLMMCGPLADDMQALWILRAEDESQAQRLVERDLFVQKSYYQSFEIMEFYPAGPHNNWLMDNPQTEGNLKKDKNHRSFLQTGLNWIK
jgi:uncharacterized protein YciI